MSLYEPFLSLLSSPLDLSKPPVPPSTLFPAISHFLLTLPRREIPSFLNSLLSSPYLFPPSPCPSAFQANLDGLQEAVRAAVETKAAAVAASTTTKKKKTEGIKGRLIGMIWRRSNEREEELTFQAWVTIVLGALTDEKTGEDQEKRERKVLPRLAGLAGLFQGLEGGGRELISKSTRREVEVEVLVLLEDEFRRIKKGKDKGLEGESIADLPPAFFIASTVFPLIPPSSLRALDLKSIANLSISLLPLNTSTSIKSNELLSLTTVLSLALEPLAGSRSSISGLLEKVVDDLDAFSKTVSTTLDPSLADTYIQTFLLPLSSTLVSLLLDHPHPSGGLASPNSSSTLLLLTWFRLCPHTARLGGLGGLEGYGRMWWGLMDLWLGEGKEEGMERVVLGGLKRLRVELEAMKEGGKERVNYYLMVVEQVLGVFPTRSLADEEVKELVVEVCEPYLEDNSNLEVFESAHSVMLALLAPPKWKPAISFAPTESSLLARVAVNYSDVILRSSESSTLSPSQLQHALSLLLPLLLTISPALPLSILYKLHQSASSSSSSSSSTSHKSLSLFASLLPSIPVTLLPRFLVQLEDVLFKSTEPGSEDRKEVVGIIWDGVGGGGKLSDEVREGVGRWWEEIRERLQTEERRSARSARAREAKL